MLNFGKWFDSILVTLIIISILGLVLSFSGIVWLAIYLYKHVSIGWLP